MLNFRVTSEISAAIKHSEMNDTNGKRLPKLDYIEVIRSLKGDTNFAFHYKMSGRNLSNLRIRIYVLMYLCIFSVKK